MARNKYDYFASRAKKDGYEAIAGIFAETALNEKEHAKMWFKALQEEGAVPATEENLLAAAMDRVMSCTLIFGLNSGAYISEIMRGGINSVDPGQLEAARAVGLSFPISMIKIVIPQAIKNILPTLGNEFIALIKETAIVGYVGALDITKYFNDQGTNSYEPMLPYLVMALLYIVIVAVIASLVKLLERSLAKNERRKSYL